MRRRRNRIGRCSLMKTKHNSDRLAVAVIGAGASGLMAAYAAASGARSAGRTADVTVYDLNPEPGRKLLVTGNGRCNLSNETVDPSFYPGSDRALLSSVFGRCPPAETLAVFAKAGLRIRRDHAGRLYPASNQAAGVREALLWLCRGAGVRTVSGCEVLSVRRSGAGFELNGSIRADRVIFAFGSPAAPGNGGTDSLHLLKDLGVKTEPFTPALAPFHLAGFSKLQLRGVRAQGSIAVYAGKKQLAADAGELQFTDYGVSGIPAMNVSIDAAAPAAAGVRLTVVIDSAPGAPPELPADAFSAAGLGDGDMPVSLFLNGMMPRRLTDSYMRIAGIGRDTLMSQTENSARKKLCELVRRAAFAVSGVGGFNEAQVCRGGAAPGHISYEDLSLKGVPGAFVCGEAANVTGRCGGYNLQWAWSSGLLAGLSAVQGESF